MATRKTSNPDAVAIHAVAKAANLSSRELMDAIAQWDLGWDATNHMKRLNPEQIQEVARRLTVDLSSILPSASADKKPAKAAPSQAAPSEKKPRAAAKKEASAKPETPSPSKPASGAEAEKPSSAATKDTSSKARAEEAAQKPLEDAPKTASKPAPAKESAPKAKDAPSTDDAKESAPHAEDTAAPSAAEVAERAKEILSNILDGMGFAHPRIRVDVSSDAVRISLAGRGTADILGQRNASARTDILEALQLVVQKGLFGNDHRSGPSVAIDVMGFREGREQELRAMAERMANYVSKTGNVLRVAAMNFIDRRAVHQGLSELDDIRTESTGYGASRALEVSKDARPKRSRDDRKDARQDERNQAPKEDRKKDRKDAPREKKQREGHDDTPTSNEKPAPKSAKNDDSRPPKGKEKQKGEGKPASDAKADNLSDNSGERKKSSRAPRKPKAAAGKDNAPKDNAKQNTDDAQ